MRRYGTYSVDHAINAGLDLEMPGPPKWRTPALITHLLFVNKILNSTLDDRARSVLTFAQKLARKSPEVVFGDGSEKTRDTPESRALNREVASTGLVLLKNENNVLPIPSGAKIAVIGPNAKGRVISGGGSANLTPNYTVSPWTGTVNGAAPGSNIRYAIGSYGTLFFF